MTPARLDGDGDHLRRRSERGDLLVHHPYESFDDSVERFISDAADDPHTVAIKMTVYRVGDDTPFVRSLIRAAETGKQVACVIELKARFDEERNLHWATELERAGAHVTVGDAQLKTHAKVALVVRQEGVGLRSYAHIGTGNYHVQDRTALHRRRPADLRPRAHRRRRQPVPPSHRPLGAAAVSTAARGADGMRQRFLELIAREAENQRAGRPARIVAKMNQLEDPAILAALCEASRAGVPIDLVVRGFCCLRPGVAGHHRQRSRSFDHRPVSRALAHLPFRRGRGRPARRRLLHRLGRLDAPQSLLPRRNRDADHIATRTSTAVGNPRHPSARRAAGMAAGRRRCLHAAQAKDQRGRQNACRNPRRPDGAGDGARHRFPAGLLASWRTSRSSSSRLPASHGQASSAASAS